MKYNFTLLTTLGGLMGLRSATGNVYSIPLLKLAILGLLFCIQG